jgi:hypothetical protein
MGYKFRLHFFLFPFDPLISSAAFHKSQVAGHLYLSLRSIPFSPLLLAASYVPFAPPSQPTQNSSSSCSFLDSSCLCCNTTPTTSYS